MEDVISVLDIVYEIDDSCELAAIFEEASIPLLEHIDFTGLCYAERFAPVLKFDGSYKGLPMSAEVYFNNMLWPRTEGATITWQADWEPDPAPGRIDLCGRDDCRYGMSNEDFQTLNNGQVPTYYKLIANSEGRLRIAYWWFYGCLLYTSPSPRDRS